MQLNWPQLYPSPNRVAVFHRYNRELHDIRITSWNLNGLGDTLGDVDVQNFLNSSDIVVLLDTMQDDYFHVDYPGFCCWHFARGARHDNCKAQLGWLLSND